MYYVENAHEAIIPPEMFEAVQQEVALRTEHYLKTPQQKNVYPFTGLIECAICGRSYRRKTTKSQVVWICSTFNTRGKQYCASKQIPETTLQYHTALVTEDISTIAKILAAPNNTLIYQLKDGSEVVQHWEDRSRAKSWTPEMRQAAKEKALAQRQEVK